MKELRVPGSGEGSELMNLFPDTSRGLSLRVRLDRFNQYLLRRAEESDIPVGIITIDEGTWAKGDEAVMAIIEREIRRLVTRTEQPPEQLPDPEA